MRICQAFTILTAPIVVFVFVVVVVSYSFCFLSHEHLKINQENNTYMKAQYRKKEKKQFNIN